MEPELVVRRVIVPPEQLQARLDASEVEVRALRQKVKSLSQGLLTIDEVAMLLAVHHRTVRRLIESHQLPVVRIGRSVRIRHGAVERFIEKASEAGR